ncbi:MAG: DNA polymerase III subunit beta [Bacteroidetes bacterium]|nr:DNA polymerase III subunit beta [Bacteroidota bacterium]
MKFTVAADQFVNSLNKLSSIVPTKSPLPILGNVLLILEGNNLEMLASDLETFIRTKTSVKGKEDGRVTVPYKKLSDLSKSLSSSFSNVNLTEKLKKSVYDDLRNEAKLTDVFADRFKYDSSSESLVYVGVLTAIDKEKIDTLIDENQKFIDSDENLKHLGDSNAKLKEVVELLYKKSESFLAKKTLEITVDGKSRMTLKTQNNKKYNLSGEPADDFPLPEENNHLSSLKINSGVLKRLIGKVFHAANKDEIRRNMSGVLLEAKEEEIRSVATDGYRLAKLIYKTTHKGIADSKIVIPVKTCNLIQRLSSEAGTVEIQFDENDLRIFFPDAEIYSKLIDETFPNYESVIPNDGNKTLRIVKKELQDSLHRALICADVITKRVKMEIKNNSVTITSENPETGTEAEETLPCNFTAMSGDADFDATPFTTAFNTGFLLDAVNQIETNEIIFKMNQPSKASIAYPTEQPDNEDFIELIMPVRVS